MIYTAAIDTLYLTDTQLQNSPSRSDGIDSTTETTLRIYGCDLIQESGILLKLPQAVMATGQLLFHRFYCKKSFSRFNVKLVAATCIWLASKLEENPRKRKHVIIVFHRMECRRENLPIVYMDIGSRKYVELKEGMDRMERILLKEIGFVCHVEHPQKFISNYLATLEAPEEVRQEAWNLANDSLRTTLCVRFPSEVVACGVVYAAARRLRVPLPENQPWWMVFDADKEGIDEVCRVLAHLYSLPKAQYVSVCKEGESFTLSVKNKDSPVGKDPKEFALDGQRVSSDTNMPTAVSEPCNPDTRGSKDSLLKVALGKRKDSDRSDDDTKRASVEGEARDAFVSKSNSISRTEASEREIKEREQEKEKLKSRDRVRDRDRGRRDTDREYDRQNAERDIDEHKERSRRSKDRGEESEGRFKMSRHYSSRDRGEHYSSSYSNREKVRHRQHAYT
ncbi:hypothetical protein ACHQM5_030198 [Ranunculus cassubicifolius]